MSRRATLGNSQCCFRAVPCPQHDVPFEPQHSAIRCDRFTPRPRDNVSSPMARSGRRCSSCEINCRDGANLFYDMNICSHGRRCQGIIGIRRLEMAICRRNLDVIRPLFLAMRARRYCLRFLARNLLPLRPGDLLGENLLQRKSRWCEI